MSHPKEWDEEEDNFDLTLSQRTEELYRIPNREPDEEGMIEAAVLPLRDLVIFPRMVSPIFVGREGSLLAVQEAQLKEQTLIGLTQHDADVDNPGPNDFLPVGVEMAVGRLLQMPDGSHSALVQGRRRVEIVTQRGEELAFFLGGHDVDALPAAHFLAQLAADARLLIDFDFAEVLRAVHRPRVDAIEGANIDAHTTAVAVVGMDNGNRPFDLLEDAGHVAIRVEDRLIGADHTAGAAVDAQSRLDVIDLPGIAADRLRG